MKQLEIPLHFRTSTSAECFCWLQMRSSALFFMYVGKKPLRSFVKKKQEAGKNCVGEKVKMFCFFCLANCC